MKRLAVLLAATCSIFFALAQGSSKSAVDKAAIEQYLRHLFAVPAEVSLTIQDPVPSQALPGFQELRAIASSGQANQEILFYVAPDGKHIVQGTVYDLTKSPFESDLSKIKTDLQPSFGTPGAPVVIVIYSDFECSYCKQEAQTIRKEVPAAFADEVRIYFKDFPLEAIHPWAKEAAIAGRCVFRQKPAAFWNFHDWAFEHQADINKENLKEKVSDWAKSAGLEPVQFNSCLETKATAAEVERSMAEGRALGINSTPTIFVNGRRLVGQAPWPQLRQIIQHEVAYAKSHGGGETCCEVKLPLPGAKQ